MPDEWVRVAAPKDVKEGEVVQVEIEEELVALARINGEVFATSDVCSHEYVLLSGGWLDGYEVECPEHGSMFDMRTGEVKNLPATQPIATYEVKVEGDKVLVRGPRK